MLPIAQEHGNRHSIVAIAAATVDKRMAYCFYCITFVAEASMRGQFDIAPLFDQLQGPQRQVLVDVVRRQVAQLPAEQDAVELACATGDAAAAGAILHRLRGALGSLGADNFVAASRALEALLKAGDWPAVPAALERVSRELGLVRDDAVAWLAGQTAQAPPAASLPASDLLRFEELLAQRNMDACTLLAQLRDGLGVQFGDAFVARIDQHMDQLDFAGALQVLRERAAA
jgi:two-component system sensor histidine kinase/response regulator